MTTDNKMDVDENAASTTEPLSRTKHASPDPSISPHDAKRPRLNDLPLDQLTTINDTMNQVSNMSFWPRMFEASSGEPEQTNFLLLQVLTHLTSKLSTTDSKSIFLNTLNLGDAVQLINNLNDEELKEWETGLEKGVKEQDWTDLITHRTYDFTLRDWMVVS